MSETRQRLGLVLALLLAALVMPAAVSAEGEVAVESVRTDAYPRVVVRFSVTPPTGSAPADLPSRWLQIAEAGQEQPAVDVYPIGRTANARRGTYEAVWQSRLPPRPGETVRGRIAVSLPSMQDGGADFTYLTPMLARGSLEGRPGPVAALPAPPTPLQAVPRPAIGRSDWVLAGSAAGVLAGLAVILLSCALWWRSVVNRLRDRLMFWVARPLRNHTPAQEEAAEPKPGRRIGFGWLVRGFGRIGLRLLPNRSLEKLRHRLVLAGRPTSQHLSRFVAIQFGATFVLAGLAFFVTSSNPSPLHRLATIGALAAAGYLLPGMWLSRTIKKRQHRIRRALPDALDLMTVGMSAGLSFDGAVGEIVDKWDNALSQEFSILLGELRVGMGRRTALQGLSDRTGVEDIKTMVTQLIQADELGMSLIDTLVTLSEQMRIRRRQLAEEQAHKATVKMLFPLVFLIFPALFVVILGPAVPELLKFVTGGPT